MIDSNLWTNAMSTLAATAAGAVVGVFGTFLISRRQSKERYEVRLSGALGSVVEEVKSRMPTQAVASPEDLARDRMIVGMALDTAAMLAKGTDAKLIQSMSDALVADLNQMTEAQCRRLFLKIVDSIFGWRSKSNSIEFYLAQFAPNRSEPND